MSSVVYFGLWIGAALVLIAVPVAKAFGNAGTDFHYGLGLPVTASNLESQVQTVWGPVPLEVQDLRSELRVPISMMPWSLVAVLWTYAAVGFGLMLLFVQNLRRILQRVRDGAPFDAPNVARLRMLSLLLFALAVLKAVAEAATSIVVRSGLAPDSPIAVPTGLRVDGQLLIFALVLMALAEVFRRGTELEAEQSLVV